MDKMQGLTGLFYTVLTLSLVGSYCILLVIAVRLVLKKVKAPGWCAYLLWGIVFLRLMCPVFPESRFSLIPRGLQTQISDRSDRMEAIGVGNTGHTANAGAGMAATNDRTKEPLTFVEEDAGDTAATGAAVAAGAKDNKEAIPGQNLPDWKNTTQEMQAGKLSAHISSARASAMGSIMTVIGAWLWLAGAVLLACYHIVCYLKLWRRVRQAVPAEPGVKEIQGEHLSFVMGIFRPVIYLSAGLDGESRRVILCHERVHLQRRDYLVKPLTLGICCVHWFNPLVWLSFYLMNKDCEMSCDERVVSLLGEESKEIYSYALLDEATRGESRKYRRGTVCALLSFGEDNVKSRIRHVLKYQKASLWIVAAAVVLLAVLVVGLCSNPGGETSSKEASLWGEGNSTVTGDEDLENRQLQDDQAENNAAASSPVSEVDAAEAERAIEQYAWDVVDKSAEEPYVLGELRLHGVSIHVTYEAGSDEGVIRYVLESAVQEHAPSEYYIAKETVKVSRQEEANAPYEVKRAGFKLYNEIQTGQMLGEIYDLSAELPFGNAHTGYSQKFARAVFGGLVEEETAAAYKVYTDPITAAVALLHLGEGRGRITETLYEAGWNFPFGEVADYGEGTVVNVSYTFAADGSEVNIPMVLAEESESMWMLSVGDLSKAQEQNMGALPGENARRVYAEFADYDERGGWSRMPIGSYVDKGTAYQISNYGVYSLGYDFQCIYPEYIAMDDTVTADIYENVMYFPTCSGYQREDLDWWYDSICALDLQTGEYAYIPLPRQVSYSFPLEYFNVNNGFVSAGNHVFLLEDTAKVWNGKKAVELSEKERTAYGVALREDILAHSDTLMTVGNHTADNTFALIDMDGDGRTEEIVLAPYDGEIYGYSPLDKHRILCGEGEETRFSENLVNEIYAFSPDGERIFIALHEEGPSADPLTTIFRYENNRLRYAGEFPGDIRQCTFEEGVISTVIGNWTVQTDGIHVQYRMTDAGELELIPQEVYEYVDKSGWEWMPKVTLQAKLPVYNAPEGTESRILEPQQVRFLRVHNSWEWVYVEGENGNGGWMHVKDGKVIDLDMPAWEVFYGLNMAG